MATSEGEEQFSVTLFSFGFKYGAPEDANLVWDVRFLPNPFWEEHLRHLTGQDQRIAEYVLESRSGKEFLDHLIPILKFLIRENREAGKDGLRIGIGCTGGHHRSVAVVEHLNKEFAREDINLTKGHRDIEKERQVRGVKSPRG